jgi:hypothetical protein
LNLAPPFIILACSRVFKGAILVDKLG